MATTKATPADCPLHDLIPPRGAAQKEHDTEITSRVGFLEGAVQTLTHNVEEVNRGLSTLGQELNRSVSALGGEIGELRDLVGTKFEQNAQRMGDALDAMTQRAESRGRPNWQAIAGFAALVVTLAGLGLSMMLFFLSGHSTQLDALKRNDEKSAERYALAQYEKGSADAFIKMAERQLALNETRFKDITDRSQRELDLALKAIEARDREHDGRIRDLQDNVLDMRHWRLTHTQESATADARLSAQMEIITTRQAYEENRARDYLMGRLRSYEGEAIKRSFEFEGLQPKQSAPNALPGPVKGNTPALNGS